MVPGMLLFLLLLVLSGCFSLGHSDIQLINPLLNRFRNKNSPAKGVWLNKIKLSSECCRSAGRNLHRLEFLTCSILIGWIFMTMPFKKYFSGFHFSGFSDVGNVQLTLTNKYCIRWTRRLITSRKIQVRLVGVKPKENPCIKIIYCHFTIYEWHK